MKRLAVLVMLMLVLFQADIILGGDFPITPHALNRTDKRKCQIAICAVFQHEAPFLKEWIEYHRLIGVEHFYLYNNLSNDDYETVLLPYIKAGIVELFDYPGTPFTPVNQTVPYKHALQLTLKQSKWFAVIDIDEFIVVTKKNINLYLYLEKKFPKVAGVVLNWQFYGTAGVWDLKPGELLIEKLTMKAPVDHRSNFLYKSIARTKYIADVAGPHLFQYIAGRHAVYADSSRFTHHHNFKKPPVDDIRINHYYFRTEKFYYEVKVPRREIYEKAKKPKQVHKDFIAEHNTVYDPVMLQYAPLLKRRMRDGF